MRALSRVWTAALLFVGVLLVAGCDDGDGGNVVGDTGAGGMGGMGDMGDTGGRVDQGEPDEGLPDEGMCVCARGVCDANGDCVDASPCTTDVECLEGNICEEGACVAGCTSDESCAAATPDQPFCIDGRCGACRGDDDCFGAATCDAATATCVEPGACDDSRECNAGRLCVDGECADRPDCNTEGCPDGFACLAGGECRLNDGARCEDNSECALGQTCLDSARPSVCGFCQTDDDCPGTQTCTFDDDGSSRCTEPASCRADLECLGARICDGDVCAQPECDDDALEPNDSDDEALPLAGGLTTGLVSCNDDWYTLDLDADTLVTVVLRQRDRGADLDLTLLTADGTVIDRSATPAATEAVTAGPFPAGRPILVHVSQNGAPSVAEYTLEVAFIGGALCVDDAHEAASGDDSAETGRLVRRPGDDGFGGDLGGRLCPGDDDYICFQVNARETITVHVEVVAGDPAIIGELYNNNGELVNDGEGRWTRGGMPTDISARGAAGIYCLRLYTEDANGGGYEVSITAVSPAVRSLCGLATPMPLPNGTGTVNAALPDEESVLSPRCARTPADGGEAIYTVTIDDPEGDDCAQDPCIFPPVLLTARLEGEPAGTLGDPVVSIRGTCEDSSTEMACADDTVEPLDPLFLRTGPAVARTPIYLPGDYSVIVDGTDPGGTPSYRLQVSAAQLAAAPRNDTCGDASPIALRNGVAEVSANLDRARDDLRSCLGSGGPDALWRLALDSPAMVRVQAVAQPAEFAVGVYLTEACNGVGPVACGFGVEQHLPAGEYYLVVDGADANARGRVTAQVTVEYDPSAPANDTCDNAEALAAGGGEVQGDTRSAADDYRLVDGNACTGHNTLGGDVVYRLPANAAGRLFVEATPVGGWDLALTVTTGCADPARDRIACSDGALAEAVVFDAPGRDAFVIIDGSNGEAGPYQLRWGPAECAGDFDCAQGEHCVDFICAGD
ncbi:MAG: hypothetical protein KC620_17440 [Myxococcales bacterium]|nr:hypothetical protein [Myxococcales bacterium]